jgi:hypothetical protein
MTQCIISSTELVTCNKCGREKPQSLMAKRRHGNIQKVKPLCLNCAAELLQQHNARMRATCFAILGGKCARCGESEPEFLTVDHVNGDGAEERLSLHPDQIKRLIVSGKADLSRYRVLCRNCNDEDGIASRFPSSHTVRDVNRRARRLRVKTEVVSFLGGSCICCRESDIHKLTVNHVKGDGSRTDLPRGGTDLYLKILSGSTNLTDFQLLCWSCNYSKHLGNGLCVHQRKGQVLADMAFNFLRYLSVPVSLSPSGPSRSSRSRTSSRGPSG